MITAAVLKKAAEQVRDNPKILDETVVMLGSDMDFQMRIAAQIMNGQERLLVVVLGIAATMFAAGYEAREIETLEALSK